MTFELKIFLYIYYAFLCVWGLFSLAAIYHMLKFGFKNFTTFITTFLFIAVSVLMLYTSFNNINKINWAEEISIFEMFSNTQTSPFQIN